MGDFREADTGAGFYMTREIEAFISYMHEERQTSENTESAYRIDLRKFAMFLQQQGVEDFAEINGSQLQLYLRELERQGRKAATISRFIASAKAFFAWQMELLCKLTIITDELNNLSTDDIRIDFVSTSMSDEKKYYVLWLLERNKDFFYEEYKTKKNLQNTEVV